MSNYRDDVGALKARIDILEKELEATRRERDASAASRALVLRDKHAIALAGQAPTTVSRLFGANAKWSVTKRYRGDLDATARKALFEQMVASIRECSDAQGRCELLSSSFSFEFSPSGSPTSLWMSIWVNHDGDTLTLRATDRRGNMLGGIWGGIGGGVGGGLAILPVMASVAVPVLTPVFVLGWLGLFGGICRSIANRADDKRSLAAADIVLALDQLICASGFEPEG